jgi:site-specific recombinase XerD
MSVSYHFYWRKDSKKKNGLYPVYLRITIDRKHSYINTGVSIPNPDEYWNSNKEKVARKQDINYKTLNQILDYHKKQAENVYKELLEHGSVTATAVKKRLQVTSKAEFFSLADELIKELEEQGNFHVLKKLKVVLKKLEKFEKKRSLPLKKINENYILNFTDHLKNKHGNTNTTINKNLGLIRKILKRAKSNLLITKNPFDDFKPIPNNQTQTKTKLLIEQIRGIEELDLEKYTSIWHTRNAFLFSFYSAGIRFGDICCLRWSNVANGRLSYSMGKNDKDFSAELNEFQIAILKSYEREGNDFIFPFLNPSKDYKNIMVLRRDISSKNVIVNKNLKQITKLLNIKIEEKRLSIPTITQNVSFHVSRHSFAQYAVNEKGLSIYEAMQALRHSNLTTTQKYLKGLDQELADKAMKKVF